MSARRAGRGPYRRAAETTIALEGKNARVGKQNGEWTQVLKQPQRIDGGEVALRDAFIDTREQQIVIEEDMPNADGAADRTTWRRATATNYRPSPAPGAAAFGPTAVPHRHQTAKETTPGDLQFHRRGRG